MRAVLVSLVQLGGMQAVIALSALIRNKVLAARLGTDGFGAYAQLALLAIAASVVVAFGLGMSLNRNVAATPDPTDRQRLLAQANGLTVVLSTVVALLGAGVLMLRPEALRIFGLEPRPAVIAAAALLLAFVPAQAAVQHRVAFLTGALDVAGMTGGRSRALALGTAVTLPLVWFFGLVGAAAQLTLLTGLIVAFLDRRLRRLGYRLWRVAFDRRALRLLAAFGVASLVAGFAQQAADLGVRSTLIRTLDAGQNGLYQAALSITYQVKAVVLGSVGAFSIATLSQDASLAAIRTTSQRLLAVVLPIAGTALGGLGLLAGPAILLLYAPSFLPAREVLPFLLFGEYLQVPVWVLGAPLLATGRIRVWLVFELTFAGLRAAAALMLLPSFGIAGVATGMAIATVIQLIAVATYVAATLELRVEGSQRAVLLTGAGVVALTSWLGTGPMADPVRIAVGLLALAAFALAGVQVAVGLPVAWRRLRRAVREAVAT
jgi:O-antigen/teichoic acid export membrane protein